MQTLQIARKSGDLGQTRPKLKKILGLKISKIVIFEDFFHFPKNVLFWTIFGFQPITPFKHIKNEYLEVALESAKNSLQNRLIKSNI